MLPEGRAGARRARPRARRPDAPRRGDAPRERGAGSRSSRSSSTTRSEGVDGQDGRALGPRVQAGDRRHPRVARACKLATLLARARRHASSATIPRPGANFAKRLRRTSAHGRRRTRLRRARRRRTRSSSSPSGAATARRTSPRSRSASHVGDGAAVVVDARNIWRPADVHARRPSLPGHRRAPLDRAADRPIAALRLDVSAGSSPEASGSSATTCRRALARARRRRRRRRRLQRRAVSRAPESAATQRDLERGVRPRVRDRRTRASPIATRCARASSRARDGVIHLAGLAGVRPSFADPARYARVNVEGTATMLEVAQRARRRRGSCSRRARRSTATRRRCPRARTRPRSCPSRRTRRRSAAPSSSRSAICRKHAATCAARRCASSRCTARASAPRWRSRSSCAPSSRGEPITMFGDGSMRRDFTHVDDIVRGVARRDRAARRRASAPTTSARARPITLDALVDGHRRGRGRTRARRARRRCRSATSTRRSPTSRARSDELGWRAEGRARGRPRDGPRLGLARLVARHFANCG